VVHVRCANLPVDPPVYRQGWFFTIFKFFVGGFVYLIVLCMGLVATFLATLKWS